MNITQEQMDQDNVKSELINDLVATSTVMDEMWRYHPCLLYTSDAADE